MNKTQLVNAVAEQANVTKRQARIAVNVVLDELRNAPVKKAPARRAPATAAKSAKRSAVVLEAKIDTRGQTPPAAGAGQR
jgi:hypothetical protein